MCDTVTRPTLRDYIKEHGWRHDIPVRYATVDKSGDVGMHSVMPYVYNGVWLIKGGFTAGCMGPKCNTEYWDLLVLELCPGCKGTDCVAWSHYCPTCAGLKTILHQIEKEDR
jgi:hypothetical protein